MKNLILFSLIVLACNSNTANNSETSTPVNENITQSENRQASSDCDDIAYFKKGKVIVSKNFDATGKVLSEQSMDVKSISVNGSKTIAQAEASVFSANKNKMHDLQFVYECDGENIYYDLTSLFSDFSKEKNAKIEFSKMQFPLNMKTGQTLPDMSGTMTIDTKGRKVVTKFTFKDWKVEKKETIKTQAGEWSCYKITNTIEADMDIPGMDDKMKEMMKSMQKQNVMTSATWFAPDFGIVKSEQYQNGKLQSYNEVTEVKN